MRSYTPKAAAFAAICGALTLLHFPYLNLPYFWDEAGYYIPAAWDIYKAWDFVPASTLPTGHTPLVMTYLALAWHIFGYSPMVTRLAMILIASATVFATYVLARRFIEREPAAWCAALLAISPLFFAQSTLVFLDLPAALFTVLAVDALVTGRMGLFAITASLAVLTKETSVVLLPVAWAWAWWRGSGRSAPFGVSVSRRTTASPEPQKAEAEFPHSKGRGQAPPLRKWAALLAPVIPLIAWTLYYHHQTGFWTGNAEYLAYNLHSTLDPARAFWSLLRRLYEVFIGGFNWLIVLGALAGLSWGKKSCGGTEAAGHLYWLAGGLIAVYVLMLSIVGGAVLPRYLLPAFPLVFVGCLACIWQLPRSVARGFCGVAAACFVAAWFINPSYPFAFENNLAYADFIRLHQDAARYLESRPPGERVLTAWPATDEVTRPLLGYVAAPLRAVPVEGFAQRDFDKIAPESFDVLYLYSRKWEPPNNWLQRFPALLRAQRKHFGYEPQIPDEILVQRYGLALERQFERRGQWVRIYRKQ